jgi:hypothetical protein
MGEIFNDARDFVGGVIHANGPGDPGRGQSNLLTAIRVE